MCVAFVFLAKPSLSQSMSFLAFALLILSPIPLRETEQETVWAEVNPEQMKTLSLCVLDAEECAWLEIHHLR